MISDVCYGGSCVQGLACVCTVWIILQVCYPWHFFTLYSIFYDIEHLKNMLPRKREGETTFSFCIFTAFLMDQKTFLSFFLAQILPSSLTVPGFVQTLHKASLALIDLGNKITMHNMAVYSSSIGSINSYSKRHPHFMM